MGPCSENNDSKDVTGGKSSWRLSPFHCNSLIDNHDHIPKVIVGSIFMSFIKILQDTEK